MRCSMEIVYVWIVLVWLLNIALVFVGAQRCQRTVWIWVLFGAFVPVISFAVLLVETSYFSDDKSDSTVS